MAAERKKLSRAVSATLTATAELRWPIGVGFGDLIGHMVITQNHGLVLVVTSKRIGLPLSLNLKSSVKLDGNDQLLGSLDAAISKLRPYDLMADDNMAADMISETPMTSATIMDVFFIKCNAA